MKKNKSLKIFTILLVIALTVTAVYAGTSPYWINSYNMTDPLDPSVTWWRDTTNQNAIAQHSEDEFPTPYVQTVYSSSELTVLVYHSRGGPNVTALISSSSFLLVGAGGGRAEAQTAKLAFQNVYTGFTNKTLKGIVLLDASAEQSWGVTYWRSIFHYTPQVPLIVNAAYESVRAKRAAVQHEMDLRQGRAYGIVMTSSSRTSSLLNWGPDGFLGDGTMYQWNPYLAAFIPPGANDIYVSSEKVSDCHAGSYWHTGGLVGYRTTLNGVPVIIVQTSDKDAGLMVFLPLQHMIFGGFGGRYLPEVGSFSQPDMTVGEKIKTLNMALHPDHMIQFTADPDTWEQSTVDDPCSGHNGGGLTSTDYLIPAYGLPISDRSSVATAVTAQKEALISLYNQTIQEINQHATADEAAAAITLPTDLASSPYNQEFVSTVPDIVRSIYQEQMGWFGGETDELASTLTPTVKAQILADAYSGQANLVAAARSAELSAQTLPAAEKALYLAHAAYTLAPDDFTVKQIYAQTLRKNAFMQKSAQVRNYYLSVAQALGTEQMVSDILKNGQEDSPLAFTSLEFSEHFSGIGGAILATVKIVSLPPAGNGILSLSGVEVTAGQEIAAADLDHLVFTPTANWNGETSFLWNGRDGSGYAATDANVRISLDPVNDAPVVSSTPLADVTVNEDASPSTLDLSTGFSDVDIATNGDVLTYAATSDNTDLVSTAVDGSSLTLTYQPNKNGQATITVTATDIAGASVSDDLAVTVNPVNDAPVCSDITLTMDEDTVGSVTLACTDAENDTLSYSIVTPPEHGALSGTAPDLTYTPAANYNGNDSFTFKANDGYADSNSATVNITVTPVNDAPVCSDITLATDEDTAGSVTLACTDVDNATLNYSIVTPPAHGALSGAAPDLTYTPAANYNGNDSFTYKANDGTAGSNVATVSIMVSPVNDAPTAADAQITVVAGQSKTIPLDYRDLETSQANLQVSFGTLKGTIDYSGLPSLKYTAPSTAGDDNFTYTVADRGDPDGCSATPCSAPLSASATVHVTVLAAPSGSISGQVYNDADGDGILDAGETGLAGVTVQLKDASGSVIETPSIAADGAYTFTGLNAGTYQVYAEILDSSRVQTTPNPAAITLAEAEAKTVNFGSVVSADLKVAMTYSVNNKQIIYAIVVTNDGPAAALNASLTDALPDGVAFVSVISTKGTCSGGKTVTCNFSTLASGGSATVTLKVNRTNTKVAIVNTVTVSSSTFDIHMADNTATVTIQ
jgi:uncharacterized repeat protein (TIGR01451 family)